MVRTTLSIALLVATGCGSAGSQAGVGGNSAVPSGGASGEGAASTAGATASAGPAAGGPAAAGSGAGGPFSEVPPAQIPPPDSSAVVIPNLDSAIINIEPVAGAKDYRAFVMGDGVQLLADATDHEKVVGATIYCAGQRQLAAPAVANPEVMKQIEVLDLHGPTTYVVEAIDELCPFPGAFGMKDTTFEIGSPDALPELKTPVPILSEASIRAKYGSMIFNGQGPGSPLGMPAPANTPKVLKRWTVQVSPVPAAEAAKRKTKDFFADFSENDAPKWVPGGTNDDGTFHQPFGYGYAYSIYQNKQFDFYTTNAVNIRDNHVFIDRGQLQMILPDAAQDTMGSVMAIPRKLAHFSDTGYLHVTFENSTNSTARRYWWLSMCGTDTPGGTFDDKGLLTQHISLNSGFFGQDGMNPSTGKWNCLIVFPHDGIGAPVPSGAKSNPQSSVIVLIHKSNAPEKQSAVDVSPQQLSPAYPAAWYRLQKGSQVTETGVLDDFIQMAPRVRFDMYVSKTRLIMYVNGQQRICNDFGPEKLTMAEAAVGFNDALYHSSAEHTELTASFADRSGQLHYLNNTLYEDLHSYDNVGFEENVAAPSDFSDADCYTYKP
jgi:hypothetical protein